MKRKIMSVKFLYNLPELRKASYSLSCTLFWSFKIEHGPYSVVEGSAKIFSIGRIFQSFFFKLYSFFFNYSAFVKFFETFQSYRGYLKFCNNFGVRRNCWESSTLKKGTKLPEPLHKDKIKHLYYFIFCGVGLVWWLKYLTITATIFLHNGAVVQRLYR